MINYAKMCRNGTGIKVNKEEALKYYKMAADTGEIDAAYIYIEDFFLKMVMRLIKKRQQPILKNLLTTIIMKQFFIIEANSKEAARYCQKAVYQENNDAMLIQEICFMMEQVFQLTR